MANVNRASGFTPVQYLNGTPWSGQARLYSITTNNTAAIAIGDPVISGGSGDANGVPNVVRAGGASGSCTGALRGVCVAVGSAEGLIANIANPNIAYWPAASVPVGYCMVVDDPFVLFEIQEESNGTQLAAADIGLNQVSLIAANNGYISGWQLRSTSGASPATTSTLQLRLMGLARKPNNAFGAYAKWLVKINVHELASDGITGVA